ncbi:MAG: hypothetical protein ACOC85_05935 [Thermoplasmatota archaeon]
MLTLVLADCTMKVGPKEIGMKMSRPDLVHFSLLLAKDSGLAEERELRTVVHTRENKVFRFEADVKIPEDIYDFKNMIVHTVQGYDVHGVKFSNQTLMEVLKKEYGNKILMTPKGDKKSPIDIFSRQEDYVVVIGGFEEGDFISPLYRWADKKISISDRLMKTWSVTAEVLVSYRYCSFE